MAHFSDRVRFNWGFHDATHDAELGHVDRASLTSPLGAIQPLPAGDQWRAYREGYVAGRAEYARTGSRPASSEPAWIAAIAVPGHGLNII